MPLICELDRRTANPDRAVILAAELLVWWRQAGKQYYGRNSVSEDEGLRMFIEDAVAALGGWRAARRTLRSSKGEGIVQ